MTSPQSPAPAMPYQPAAYPAVTTPVTVTAIDVSFFRLVGFFFKAALAALPAILAAALVVKLVAVLVFWAVGGWRYGWAFGPTGWL